MPLQEHLENLENIKRLTLSRHYFTGPQAITPPDNKRFSFAHTKKVLGQLTPLEEAIRQHQWLGLESDLLLQQIAGAEAAFENFDPLVDEAKSPDTSTGWLWFKKTIPGQFYISKLDTAALNDHMSTVAPFIPSQPLISLGRQVSRLKDCVEKSGDLQPIYEHFRELYHALHEEEATRQLTKSTDTYLLTAHEHITQAFTKVARDIANYQGIPPRLKSLETLNKRFQHLETRTLHPKVRTAAACVIGAIIGGAIGLTLGFFMGGFTAIPAMFVGAALFSTLSGTGFMLGTASLITGSITHFHAQHKIKRHTAHRSLLESSPALCEAINQVKKLTP